MGAADSAAQSDGCAAHSSTRAGAAAATGAAAAGAAAGSSGGSWLVCPIVCISTGITGPVVLLGWSTNNGSLRLGGLEGLACLLSVHHLLLLVAEEEQIGHHVPLDLPGDGAPEAEHLASDPC